jgi:hypothetical protein
MICDGIWEHSVRIYKGDINMDYSNFISNCIKYNLPMDEVMKTEIEFLYKTYSMEKFIDIMIHDFIPSLHHESNRIKENYFEYYINWL